MTSTVPFRAGGPDEGSGALEPLAAGPSVLLADISEFNPQVSDAAYLAWSRAIVIRAMYGDAHDDHAWYGGQRRALLHAGGARFLGIYAYLVAGQSGAAQAQAFRDLVGAIRPGEVFVADFEEGAKPELSAWYGKMLALYGQGIAPFLWTYTGLYFGEAQGVMPVQWIADYGAPEPSTPHKLWQFTASYQVPGVGLADCNVFHGTIDELAALAYQPSKPVPPPAPPVPSAPAGLSSTLLGVDLGWHPVTDPATGKPAARYRYQVAEGISTHPGSVCATAVVAGTSAGGVKLRGTGPWCWRSQAEGGQWSEWTAVG